MSDCKGGVVVAHPEPSAPEKAAIAQAIDRRTKRRPRVSLKIQSQADGIVGITSSHSDYNGWTARINEAFGTTSQQFAAVASTQLNTVAAARGTPATEADLNAALAFVDGVGARDEMEACLAVAMYGSHAVGMDLLARARQAGSAELAAIYTNAATKLHRTFVAQAETIAKLRRGGEQKVTVEHVHVHAGGQAIVGAVSSGGGVRPKSEEQPHA